MKNPITGKSHGGRQKAFALIEPVEVRIKRVHLTAEMKQFIRERWAAGCDVRQIHHQLWRKFGVGPNVESIRRFIKGDADRGMTS